MTKKSKQKSATQSRVVRVEEAPIPGLQERIWKRNRVDQLPEGLSLARNGRAGHLYDRKDDYFIDIDVELAGGPGLDIVVYVPETLHWVHVDTFEQRPLSAQERQAQIERFRAYLDASGLRYSL